MFSIVNKKILINGGTAGIGLALAKHFANYGAQVVAVGRREVTEIDNSVPIRFFQKDLASEQGVIDALTHTATVLGSIDVVINNAGLDSTGSTITDGRTDQLREAFELNSHSVYWSLKHSPNYMPNGGSIINTASIAGFIAAPGYSQYGASKATVLYYSRAAALVLAPKNIRVNCVCPGSIETDMLPQGHPERPLAECLAPQGRVGTTDDLLAFYHLLVSDDSRFMTGQSLVVDGGISAGISYCSIEKILC